MNSSANSVFIQRASTRNYIALAAEGSGQFILMGRESPIATPYRYSYALFFCARFLNQRRSEQIQIRIRYNIRYTSGK
jgi:hypothetical protein